MTLDWVKLTFGKYRILRIQSAVRDADWQYWRLKMKGKSLKEKYDMLVEHLKKENYSENAKIQVTNYVNALRRAGMVDPQ